MISRSILFTAKRIRARYLAWHQDRPHVRLSPAMVACGARPSTACAYPLSAAIDDACTFDRAADLDLHCEIEADDLPWDGECGHPGHKTDCNPPRHVLCAIVRDASGRVRASLGGIGVDSLDDPYLDTIRAEVYAEAITEVESELDREATIAANELAQRATYAGGV